jgi:hypothetical protein
VETAETAETADAGEPADTAEPAEPSRPLLLLDVDGPLNPYAVQPDPCATGYASHMLKPTNWVRRHGGVRDDAPPLRVDLNPAHGPSLTALASAFELVWATSWMDEANEEIGPRIGLPRLPYIDWGAGLMVPDPGGLLWKTRMVVAFVAGRPFAWVDDEFSDDDRAWVAAHHPGRALLHTVPPEVGLTDRDFAVLAEWARSAARFR